MHIYLQYTQYNIFRKSQYKYLNFKSRLDLFLNKNHIIQRDINLYHKVYIKLKI